MKMKVKCENCCGEVVKTVQTKDNFTVCSNWCKDDWETDAGLK